jgi:hypothetical protein
VLFDGRSRAFVAFDVSRHMDRFDVFQVGETGLLAPVQELTNRLVVRDPGVLIADRNGEEFNEPLGGFWSDFSNNR